MRGTTADVKSDRVGPGLVERDGALLEWRGLGAGKRLDLDRRRGWVSIVDTAVPGTSRSLHPSADARQDKSKLLD